MSHAHTLLAAAAAGFLAPAALAEEFDWRTEWELADGLALDVDSSGYELPAGIAVVPNPGSAPGDPLYFVTELRGRVKVVTNDRHVLTFAEDIAAYASDPELPDPAGEYGVAGICLAPERGYVFVTFAYWDEAARLRNAVLRYETKPVTFATKPASAREFREPFAGDPSATSHQIGSCDVSGDSLYVGVGDGYFRALAGSLDSTNGKILRFTLDVAADPRNPYYDAAQPDRKRGFVFASGLRNPYSLRVVEGRAFAAENGPGVDRFFPVEPGARYAWDGSDWSIGLNSPLVLAPAVGPAQLAFHPEKGGPLPDAYRGRFLLATSGVSERAGAGLAGEKSVLVIDYDRAAQRMRAVPRPLLRFVGKGTQIPAGVAVGADGVYVVPVLPDGGGRSSVLRIHAGGTPHPYAIGGTRDGRSLLNDYGCLGCHTFEGRGGVAAPSLEPGELLPRLNARLADAAYAAQLAAAPTEAQRTAGEAVLAAPEADRPRAWLVQRILDPRFDMPSATMPDLDVAPEHAEAIAALLAGAEVRRPGERRSARAPVGLRERLLRFPLGHGLAAAAGATIAWIAATRLRSQPRSRR